MMKSYDLIIDDSLSGKTKVLPNLAKHQRPSIDNIYQLLINKRKEVGIKKLKNLKAFIDHWQTIDVYQNLEDNNRTKKSVDSVWWYDSRYGS